MIPKISVIIPVYNAADTLKETLQSVLAQSLKAIEIICVDDGSTDSSLTILKEYAKADFRIKVFEQKNLYAGIARNTGIKNAVGDYLFFMDADDFCDTTLLEKAYSLACKDNSDIVVFDYYKFNTAEKSQTAYKGLNVNNIPNVDSTFSYEDIPNTICNTINPTPWNKIIRRRFIQDNHIFYEGLSTTNDITFATVCAIEASRISYLPQPLYYYRIGNENNITSKKRNNLDNIINAVLSVYEQVKSLPQYNLIVKSLRRFVVENLFVGVDRYAGDTDSIKCVQYRQKIESILCCHPLFVGTDAKSFANKNLATRINDYKKRGLQRFDLRFLSRKIIVSFTSYPARINVAHKVVASILEQTVKPDYIILWLSKEQFPRLEDDLPLYLREYLHNGLEIRWCEGDLKSHKKYYYALKEFPSDIIITVDDDLKYDQNMIKKLMISYLEYPNCVSAMRVHLMRFDETNNILPYSTWPKEYKILLHAPSMALFSTSGAGTLYPPYCMEGALLTENVIKTCAFNADDVLLKCAQVLKGTAVVLATKDQHLHYIGGTQDETLYQTNIYDNDVFIKNTVEYISQSDLMSKEDFINLMVEDNAHYNRHNSIYTHNVLEATVEKKDCEIAKLKKVLKNNQQDLSRVKNGLSFKIGRIITWLPRKLMGRK